MWGIVNGSCRWLSCGSVRCSPGFFIPARRRATRAGRSTHRRHVTAVDPLGGTRVSRCRS